MDENKIVTDLIKLYADNSGYFKDALDQAQTAMYISITSIFVSLIVSLAIGYLNYHIAKKGLKLQADKAYHEIITNERVKEYNLFRNAVVIYMERLDDVISFVEEIFLFNVLGMLCNSESDIKSRFKLLSSKIHMVNCAYIRVKLQADALELKIVEEKHISIINQFRGIDLSDDQEYTRRKLDKVLLEVEPCAEAMKKILDARWNKINNDAKINT